MQRLAILAVCIAASGCVTKYGGLPNHGLVNPGDPGYMAPGDYPTAQELDQQYVAEQAKKDRDRESIRRALSSVSDNLNSIAAAKQKQAESLGRSADEIGRMSSQYEAERAAQRAQQQIADQQARQIAQQRARPAAANVPVRSDPLAPASAPAQTAESRRAAGLPDDPSAAACIQDDDCARAVLPRH